jgi:hypothetical protein
MSDIKFSRHWAMPSADTFSIKPIGEFVNRHLKETTAPIISIDPFARNKRWATYTNDLNPDTTADYHLEALDYLTMLKNQGIMADIVIFDPPYSPRQVSECYTHVGKKTSALDTSAASWANWKKAIAPLVKVGGKVLCFGWNSGGMGLKLGFTLQEILMVAHGGMHNDTICTMEVKNRIEQPLLQGLI